METFDYMGAVFAKLGNAGGRTTWIYQIRTRLPWCRRTCKCPIPSWLCGEEHRSTDQRSMNWPLRQMKGGGDGAVTIPRRSWGSNMVMSNRRSLMRQRQERSKHSDELPHNNSVPAHHRTPTDRCAVRLLELKIKITLVSNNSIVKRAKIMYSFWLKSKDKLIFWMTEIVPFQLILFSSNETIESLLVWDPLLLYLGR